MKVYELIDNETTFLPVGTLLYEIPQVDLLPMEVLLIEKEKAQQPIPCHTCEGLRQLIPLSHLKELEK